MSDLNADRSGFSSTFGAVLATAGVAIGLGNIWRFPYTMGEHGGGAFLFVYLVIIVAFGLPALMAELTLGRLTGRGPVGALRAARLPGAGGWGWLIIVTLIMAVAYYSVAVGWTLGSVYTYINGGGGESSPLEFASLTGSSGTQFAYTALGIAFACGAVLLGVRRGIQRLSQIIMPLFALLFVILLVRVLTLEGAMAGVRQLVRPSWSDLDEQTLLAAVGQAVFSLGLGGTMMIVYGGYMRANEQIPRNALLTAGADLTAALLAGFIVVPAAIVFKVSLASGPSLMFDVMPQVFDQMTAGRLFALMFFVGVFLVSFLSVVAAFEVLIVTLKEQCGVPRPLAVALIFITQIALVWPLIAYGVWAEITDFVWITTMMPVGSIIAVVALAWCVSRARALGELRRHSDLPVPGWLHAWVKYVIPLVIGFTIIYGWATNARVQAIVESILN